MLAQMVLFVVVLLLMSGLLHIVPGLTRPDIFFAVTVSPEFRGTSGARRILRKYRAMVWGSALVAIALELATGMALAAVLLQAIGFLWSLVSAHKAALAYAAAPGSVVEVDLAAPRERLPGGPIMAALPLLSLVALGLWASLHMDRMPRRFPVHWGVQGADQWVATTPVSIFGYLGVHAAACLLLIGIAWGLLNWSRRITTTGAGAAAERRFRGRIVQMLIVSGYFVACPAWFAVLHPASATVNVWSLALAAVVGALTVSLMRGGQGGSRAAVTAGGAPVGDRTPDACWKWGLFYVNAADPSILIEKRFGIGYTLNFGNRWTWVVLALLLVPAAALVFLR
ncbi:MAG: DUF5808 domain-containing protein [Bryobacteraceae bacterium]|jgi:uncharacterized membrane protein